MTIQKIWHENTIIKPFETDFLGRWKPHCYFQCMQWAATNHAAHLGLGYHAMLENEMVWLLGRLKLRILRTPSLGEQISIETWPRGLAQKIFFMRDFFFRDEKGDKIAAATSAWLLVHVTQRRILKPSTSLPAQLPDLSERLALEETLEKIEVPEVMQEKRIETARYSDVDMMGHVNNTRYIEWTADCFSHEQQRCRELAWVQINYANEVKPGEKVSIRLGEHPSGHTAVQGINLETGSRAFETALVWRQT